MQEHLIGHKYNYKSHKCNNNKHLVTNKIKLKSHKCRNIWSQIKLQKSQI